MIYAEKKKVKYRLQYWWYIGKLLVVTGVSVKICVVESHWLHCFSDMKKHTFWCYYSPLLWYFFWHFVQDHFHLAAWNFRCVDLILMPHIIKWKKKDHKWFPGKWKLPAHQLHLACITSPRKQLSLSFRSLLSDALSLSLFAIRADVMYPE